jgi:hypothetical protein
MDSSAIFSISSNSTYSTYICSRLYKYIYKPAKLSSSIFSHFQPYSAFSTENAEYGWTVLFSTLLVQIILKKGQYIYHPGVKKNGSRDIWRSYISHQKRDKWGSSGQFSVKPLKTWPLRQDNNVYLTKLAQNLQIIYNRFFQIAFSF